MEKLVPMTDLGRAIADDRTGVLLRKLQSRLAQESAAAKRAADRGVTPAEAEAIETKRLAIDQARRILDVVHGTHHAL